MKIVIPNSQEEVLKALVHAWYHSVLDAHGAMYNKVDVIRDLKKVLNNVDHQGVTFLTKVLPKFGKALDRALAGDTDSWSSLRLRKRHGTELPLFSGGFLLRIFNPNGQLLDEPCVTSIRLLREISYMFYKYELPYKRAQEQAVVDQFVLTDEQICSVLQEGKNEQDNSRAQINLNATSDQKSPASHEIVSNAEQEDRSDSGCLSKGSLDASPTRPQVSARRYRKCQDLLERVFLNFDGSDINPSHGPGAVAQKERLEQKYMWSNVPKSITDIYPYDAYYCASSGHVCDSYNSWSAIREDDRPARVLLVPKDSRGPRLISCEPVERQWVQQGLGRAIVQHVERHPLTKWNVFFTDQGPNQRGALLGSRYGKYATLDLKEASDRVAWLVVRDMFPSRLIPYLEACRSAQTLLPDGRIIKLNKFAPMGSSLCFPIMALTIWAILTTAAADADTRESILVYGDDVIVPTAFAEDAIKELESFGLLINRDKSFIKGFFKESCGTDAFQGNDVTPVRVRTAWSSSPSANVYASWISYANSFYDRRYYRVYNLIVDWLFVVYGRLPSEAHHNVEPSLRYVHDEYRICKKRWNSDLQRSEFYVPTIYTRPTVRRLPGWQKLLRFFAESSCRPGAGTQSHTHGTCERFCARAPLSVGSYTDRGRMKIRFRWR